MATDAPNPTLASSPTPSIAAPEVTVPSLAEAAVMTMFPSPSAVMVTGVSI